MINFYKKYYRDFKLCDVFKIYESNNCLEEIEKSFLLLSLSIPSKIVFSNNHLLDVKIVNNEIIFLKKVYEYINNNQGKS